MKRWLIHKLGGVTKQEALDAVDYERRKFDQFRHEIDGKVVICAPEDLGRLLNTRRIEEIAVNIAKLSGPSPIIVHEGMVLPGGYELYGFGSKLRDIGS